MTVTITKATDRDVRYIWRLRNTRDVQAVSRRQHHLPYSEYRAEILDTLDEWWIINTGGRRCGYIRAAADGEIGVALAGWARGQGIAPKALSLIHQHQPGRSLTALIRPGNASSIRAFEKARFAEHGRHGEFILYRRTASRPAAARHA